MLNATIWSAPANKFYAKEKQLKFAHLNVDLNWAKGSASGLLTELAGDRPMSRASRPRRSNSMRSPTIGDRPPPTRPYISPISPLYLAYISSNNAAAPRLGAPPTIPDPD